MLNLEGMVKECGEVIYPVLAVKLWEVVFGLWFLVFVLSRRFSQMFTDQKKEEFKRKTLQSLFLSAFIGVHLRPKTLPLHLTAT